MTKKELFEISQEKFNIYGGILFHNQEFESESNAHISYDFSCPEFKELKEKYNLEAVAGKGSDFTKAKRLLHFLADNWKTHQPWYDGHVACNALALLEYSFGNPEHGINCKYKSKVLEECCLALGIYARRVFIMPYSPYDFDNHVVTEIYDRKMKKWIMLDPTLDAYVINEEKTPLSIWEIRDCFANMHFATIVFSNEKISNPKKCAQKVDNMEATAYICKNLFYLEIDKENKFGDCEASLLFCPKHYSIKQKAIQNMEYRLANLDDSHAEWREIFEKRLEEAKNEKEPVKNCIDAMLASPDNNR